MDTYYADWSMRRGVTYIMNDDDEAHTIPGHAALEKLATRCQPGDYVIAEAAYESYSKHRQAIVREAFAARGINFLTIATTGTRRVATEVFGANAIGALDDETAARAIRWRVQHGAATRVAANPDPEKRRRHEESRAAYIELRFKPWGTRQPTGRERTEKFLTGKEWLTEQLRALLGKDGLMSSDAIPAAVAVAVAYSDGSRDSWDALLGLHHNRARGPIGAALLHDGWRSGKRKSKPLSGLRAAYGDDFSAYRRAIRCLAHDMTPCAKELVAQALAGVRAYELGETVHTQPR